MEIGPYCLDFLHIKNSFIHFGGSAIKIKKEKFWLVGLTVPKRTINSFHIIFAAAQQRNSSK